MTPSDETDPADAPSLTRRARKSLLQSRKENEPAGSISSVEGVTQERFKERIRPAFKVLGVASAAFALGAFALTLLPIHPDDFAVCSETRTVVEDESDETPDITTERSCQPISVTTGAPLAALIVALALATPLLFGLVPPGGELTGPGGVSYKRALETTVDSEDRMWEATD